ncbi:MAG: HAMP domain-containing protein [Rhodoferax sp.]|uniref:sensor histidine kinase n=1 Tax=Rhodoferax sp. TaxID=50421 RepID=UPI001B458DE3|nr:sensor histidine kinase [Rhodoferax sp.]MBP9906302.1 HAMP domain-containing protein [Rhodoferax sp.]
MKFRTKTVLGVMLIQTVLLSVLVLSVLSQMRSSLRQQIELRANVTAQLVAAAARDPMVSYDVSTLKSLVTDLLASGQVAFVDFLDDRGRSMVTAGTGSGPPVSMPDLSGENLLTRDVLIKVAGNDYGHVRFGIRLDEMTELLELVKRKTVAMALGVMVAVAVFSLFLGKLLTRRLNELTAASHQIAAGNLSHQIDEQGNDELADTARSFNQMSGRLQQRNQELLAAQHSLSALNATLEQRVAERTAALQETSQRLQAEQERSLQAEKMASLGRMVAGFAHEVNTPVGIAVGAVSQAREVVKELGACLRQEEVTEEDLLSRLHTLEDVSELALNNLRRTADLVHRFKRTAVDQTSEQMRPFELAEVVEDVMKSLRNEFKNTPIRFEVDCAGCQTLYGPAGIVAQLLVNLMQNSRLHAFAAGTVGGCIRIQARTGSDTVSICYADDGAGMAAETLAHIFEPFYTTARGQGGTGLGMYIAHNLVTQGLRGSIACHSAPGQGTRFDITFPLQQVTSFIQQP